MNGVLNIDKPAGWTSHDVVAKVRRLLRTKRAGHAGTLDPDAVGVLVVAVGQATRLLPFLPLEPKVYLARATFGAATTTEDASGETVTEADASALTEDALRAALPGFIGQIAQVPPMVSALHHDGQRLYDLARQGITVERDARTVTIHAIELREFTPGPRASATLEVVCGGGTYIRTLCKDLGEALGLPAHMESLARTGVGPFLRDDSVALEGLGPEALLPMEKALSHLPAVALTDDDRVEIAHGRTVAAPESLSEPAECVALLHRERLTALARLVEGRLQPYRVFADADA